MDQERFDQIARGLASGATRRGVVRNLAGAALGGLLAAVGTSEGEARKKKGGKGKGNGKGNGKGEERDTVDVCHYDPESKTWESITVSQKDWDSEHAKHKKDYLLDGGCCTDRDCKGDKSCRDGVCTDDGPPPCTTCGDGCLGDPENNPTKTLAFTPSSNPDYCNVSANLTGFTGCTSYTAEYWAAISTSGFRARYIGNVTLGPTDLSGSSQTTLGTYAKGGAVDIRFAGDTPNYQWVDC